MGGLIGSSGLIGITIPSSVTSIEGQAFFGCSRLTRAIFMGNAPSLWMGGYDVFANTASGFTVYYYNGNTGFTSPPWNGYPTRMAAPEIKLEQPAGTVLATGGTMDFSTVGLGTSATKIFAIKNLGTADLTGLAVVEDGTHAADFTVGTPVVVTLSPDGSTTFEVTFTPSATGIRSAALHIASNDPTNSPFDINLTGTGTATLPPGVTNGSASGLTASAATLSGTVNPHGSATTVRFEYGPSTSYGGTADVTLSPNNSASAQNVSTNISGLQQATTYHYRLTATNWAGTTLGADMEFTTYPTVPYTYTFSNNTVTITGYTGSGGAVNIPSMINGLPVTAICSDAFANCNILTSVTIPASVTSIGDWAFLSCTNLTTVTITPGVTRIGTGTFLNCVRLTSLTFPASVVSIGDFAFLCCTALNSVVFLGNAPLMGVSAFHYTGSAFKVYYTSGASGFTSPSWEGYPSVDTGNTSSFAIWLMDNGFPPDTNAQLDPNHDGVNLLMAYALSLDPNRNLSGSMPWAALSGNQMSLTYFAGSPGITYTPETSTDLENWSTNGVMVSPSDSNHFRTATVPMTGANRFMRLVLSY